MLELTDQTIDIARVLAAVTDPTCGAEVLFIGTTRQWTGDATYGTTDATGGTTDAKYDPAAEHLGPRETSHLVYDCYREMALSQLQRLADTAKNRWPVHKLAIVHRLGRVDPTEASVAVAVSCPHRSEAFEAAKWLIDELKHQVPIWKQEHYVQSGAEWIHPTDGNCRCTTPPRPLPNASAGSLARPQATALGSEKTLQQQSQQQ